ncbi:MAG: protein rep [Peptostreptococcaceae bacterium]
MKIEDLKAIEVKKDFISDIIKNNKYNQEVISEYYFKLQQEFKEINFQNKIDNLSNCNSWWLLDYYKQQGVKDFKKTNLCKDKFCNNCKKVKQASRLGKYMPMIEQCKQDKSLYHLTLTVPNCKGEDLAETIKTMFLSFRRIIRYLSLDKKIKGLDFEQYSYIGAIRSLEVTFKGDSYHPHLHCIFAFDKPLNNYKYIENTYSNSRKNGYRKFTDFEILIQKIWYLLNNKIKVTKNSIDELELGYSCTIDPIDESSAYEVFKYMTKSTDEDQNILTYENFKTLYFALHRVRQIQGYGCFYNVKDDDSIIEQVEELYDVYINILKVKENPLQVSQTPEDLMKDNDNLIISRKKIYSYLKNLN